MAITDDQQIFAFGLKTIPTTEIFIFLEELLKKEKIECIVIGEAVRRSGEPSEVELLIQPLINHIKNKYSAIKLERQDESLSSKLAVKSMVDAGFSMKDRRKKENIDLVSATLILQAYLEKKQI